VTEVPVHVLGGRVARLAGVDDDDGAALAAELQGGREPGGRSAHHGDVAVTLDRSEPRVLVLVVMAGVVVVLVFVCVHEDDDRVGCENCTSPCGICKKGEAARPQEGAIA
jgi:hypothetical protein